jgi:hypothetical protein
MVSVVYRLNDNWGVPFIAIFLILITTTAFALASGMSSIAGIMASYAYIALVLGVILQVFSWLRNCKRLVEYD